MVKVHEVAHGKSKRYSYSRNKEVFDMPNLIAIQKDSYRHFCEVGLKEAFRDISPITDSTGKLQLEFDDYVIEDKTNYTIEQCKERDATYSSPLKVKVRFVDKNTGVQKEEQIFMGDFPKMTDNGTFVLNGAERVIVSQLVRSPGVYFEKNIDKAKNRETVNMTIIPNRGAWIECEIDHTGVVQVRIDRNRKVCMTTFLRALGYNSDDDIKNLFAIDGHAMATPEAIAQWGGLDERILDTINKETPVRTKDEELMTPSERALIEIHRKLKPGEPATVESARSHLFGMLFEPRRYDLAKVGRYKLNKKLALGARIKGFRTFFDVVDPENGELLAKAGDMLSEELAFAIQDAGINDVVVIVPGDKPVRVIGNNTVDMSRFVDFDPEEIGIHDRVNFTALTELCEAYADDPVEVRMKKFRENINELLPKTVTESDIIASLNYILYINDGVGFYDDIDHLGNRRIRSVGELLQNQFRIGLARLEQGARDRMSSMEASSITPTALVNIRPINAAIKEFFGSSQLSQFMDQTNPLAELANKRRLSALGPGGLNRDRATFQVRDVHYSHYGRMCPIETPEGPNIGLIGSLSTYARVNEYGFIEAPYRRYDSEKQIVTDQIDYLMADEEDRYIVAQANEPLDDEGHFINSKVVCRYKDEFIQVEPERVNYMDVSPKQVVSVGAAMIPFLENDDASRALMGCNMQRQAVPLIRSEAPIVATGIEYKAAVDSGSVVLAKKSGVVKDVTARYILVENDDGTEDIYHLLKFMRSNQDTCINQKPIVRKGERVIEKQVIADGPSTDKGEIALGRNMLIAFMTWEGYNYEDAVLISEKVVKEDIYTSIHIKVYECEARETKLGPEEITADMPQIGDDQKKYLDENGIIMVGAEVKAGDILVGKVTPKGDKENDNYQELLNAFMGPMANDTKNTPLRVPHGEGGVVVKVEQYDRENSEELANGVLKKVCVYVAQKRKLSVGDKMAGRHGNKGVVSRILPEEDMPYMPDGTPVEIVLNPLGVPSRMNIGQVLEVHLGYAAKTLGWKIETPVFDGASEQDIVDTLKEAGLPVDGKVQLYDGRTGEPFDHKVTVGVMYYLKLHHLVDDKIHARSIGPYSLVTQQPLGGKAQFGGQRFGEMEVWALEAYGAAYTLQEILTVKSDDVFGRNQAYKAIKEGASLPEPAIPESFMVLVKELQGLALDVRMYTSDGTPIKLKEAEEEYVKNPNMFRNKRNGKSRVQEREARERAEELAAAAAENPAEEDTGFTDVNDADFEDVPEDVNE
ncbi:MAG: DNA-directed RNA polymerase subunit beta [Clostridia bacterium]|nr:DNA-directed RNA polymerase subunit beta [Clostridia bacterium]MBP5666490.1 DNA-directed RNA polymerase subunit beta [Clostridia bacterium]